MKTRTECSRWSMGTRCRIGIHRRGNTVTGFTLIELLVVIAIIAVLAGLLVVVAVNAINTAKNARIAVEIGELSKALQQFKVQYGSYPPDFSLISLTDAQQFEQFMARNFRTRNKVTDRFASPPNSASLVDWANLTLDPSEALFFWLGGESPDAIAKQHGGFSKDPIRPKAGSTRGTALFNFDKSRLQDRDNDGFYEYYPSGLKQPYVYLASDNYIERYRTFQSSNDPVIFPYVRRLPDIVASPQQSDFVEDAGFQIVSAGLDDDYGVSQSGGNPAWHLFPSGPYLEGHKDNITNFSEGTLENKLP